MRSRVSLLRLLLRLSLYACRISYRCIFCTVSHRAVSLYARNTFIVCTRTPQLFRGKPFDLVSFARREHPNVCCWQIFSQPSATDIYYYYCYTRTLCRFKRKFAVRLMWFIYTDSLPFPHGRCSIILYYIIIYNNMYEIIC